MPLLEHVVVERLQESQEKVFVGVVETVFRILKGINDVTPRACEGRTFLSPSSFQEKETAPENGCRGD